MQLSTVDTLFEALRVKREPPNKRMEADAQGYARGSWARCSAMTSAPTSNTACVGNNACGI